MAEEIRLAAAMKLYELGRLSSGAAAALAGVHEMRVPSFRPTSGPRASLARLPPETAVAAIRKLR
jgi:Uncharacterised protein family (UPF0175)